jgi:alpha-maltose-1-phosphate synthase
LKVVISTAGRFHLFALARELEKRGHLERIYSGFVWNVLARENVSRDKVRTYPWFRSPYMALGRSPIPAPRRLAQWLESMSCIALDAHVARHLPTCDVFIGHDGAGLKAGREAHRRGCIYITDTGTSHLSFRRNLLLEEFALCGVPPFVYNASIVDQMLAEYATADAITVPSTYVKDSFVGQGIPASKVHLIPYGVRTEDFHPVSEPPLDLFRVLFVGGVSIRKGARYLFEAFRGFPHPNKELTIAGTVAEEVRPLVASLGDLNVKFLGHIPHTELNHLYSSSHALVLPSIDEGLRLPGDRVDQYRRRGSLCTRR